MVTNSIGTRLKLVPAGSFLMGASLDDTNAEKDEKPQHKVRITRPFYLGVYEVTQYEYRQVMNDNPSHFRDSVLPPVESVSWLDAVKFCNKLSEREGRGPYYRIEDKTVTTLGGNGYRLPTEAKWEYAAAPRKARAPPRSIRLGITKPTCRLTPGLVRIRERRHTRLDRRSRTLGASTTCRAMYGSGARTSIRPITTVSLRKTIRRVQRRPRAGSSGAVAGATTPRPAARRTVAGSGPEYRGYAWDSVGRRPAVGPSKHEIRSGGRSGGQSGADSRPSRSERAMKVGPGARANPNVMPGAENRRRRGRPKTDPSRRVPSPGSCRRWAVPNMAGRPPLAVV